VYRQVRGLALVRRRVDDETIQVDRIGHAAQLIEAPVAAASAALELGEETRQAGGAHAEEFDIHLGHVDADDRQAIGALARQDAALAGESGGRRQVDRLDLLRLPGLQGAAIGRDHAGEDFDREGLLRRDVGEARRAVTVLEHPGAVDRLAVLVGDLEVLRQVLRFGQGPREAHGQRRPALAGLAGDRGHGEAFDRGRIERGGRRGRRLRAGGRLVAAGAEQQRDQQQPDCGNRARGRLHAGDTAGHGATPRLTFGRILGRRVPGVAADRAVCAGCHAAASVRPETDGNRRRLSHRLTARRLRPKTGAGNRVTLATAAHSA
jgi:hypothetical protein